MPMPRKKKAAPVDAVPVAAAVPVAPVAPPAAAPGKSPTAPPRLGAVPGGVVALNIKGGGEGRPIRVAALVTGVYAKGGFNKLHLVYIDHLRPEADANGLLVRRALDVSPKELDQVEFYE